MLCGPFAAVSHFRHLGCMPTSAEHPSVERASQIHNQQRAEPSSKDIPQSPSTALRSTAIRPKQLIAPTTRNVTVINREKRVGQLSAFAIPPRPPNLPLFCSAEMVEPSPGCFSATAQTFQDGLLSFEQFIDINLRHFSGERHNEDAEGTDFSLARLSWLGSDMGRVSAAIKICILEPGFAVPPGL
jgi:hypothetical protein